MTNIKVRVILDTQNNVYTYFIWKQSKVLLLLMYRLLSDRRNAIPLYYKLFNNMEAIKTKRIITD